MDIVNFKEIKPNEYTDKTFGICIRRRREELKISVRTLAEKIGMSPVYLSDIERGNRTAPVGTGSKKNYMEAFIRELRIADDEKDAFYAMANVSVDRYDDVRSYLAHNGRARIALRLADQCDVPDEVWDKFIERLEELNSQNKI